jgi:hypothetical protein
VPGDDLYLPTATNKLVRGIQLDSGIPLQSAAKVPIMITFNVVDREGNPNDIKPQACIFKVNSFSAADSAQKVCIMVVIFLSYMKLKFSIHLSPFQGIYFLCQNTSGFIFIRMTKIVVNSSSLTQSLLLYRAGYVRTTKVELCQNINIVSLI